MLDPPADVIDIVTDDMPFLVDSLTMELAKHGLAARLVVHPQLRVRRDVTGALREIVGAASAGQLKDDGASHDELAESWTHIEIPPLADGEAEGLAADLLRVLGDVRVAVEDYARMRARALSLADALTPEGYGEARGGMPAPVVASTVVASTVVASTVVASIPVVSSAVLTPRLRSPSCCAGSPTGTSRSSATASTTWRPGQREWR